ncbi:MAG: riboflavin biosynthesis protein RibF [Bacteroidales bacterium]|nr:riboflavin biosynthesis protein RibF [Bacteroidales bacterium]
MEIYRSFEDGFNIKNPVVTTGSFDGVHIGHKAIINRINKIASDINGESVLITFFPHPRKVLYPNEQGKGLKFINSLEEKIQLLSEAGLNHLFIINFTLEFSMVSSLQFVQKFLVDKLHAKVIVVGFNHHFGHNRTGDYHYLFQQKEKFGFEVEEIPEQELHHETISSTKIRAAINDGYIQKANAYLDSYYFVSGKIKAILNKSEQTGIKIVIECIDKLLPPSGSYVVSSVINEERFKGAAYIIKNRNNENNRQFVFVWFINKINIQEIIKNITIQFHKRMAIIKTDEDNYYTQFMNEKEYIEELVF